MRALVITLKWLFYGVKTNRYFYYDLTAITHTYFGAYRFKNEANT